MKSPFSTADLSDANPHCGSCEIQFNQYGARRQFFGQIRTVKCIDDNLLLRRTIETPSSGEVLVVDGGGVLGSALVGNTLAEIGLQNGWSGVVLYGGVRDVLALSQLNFGIKALGCNAKRARRNGTGQIDIPVSFGGLTFTRGHWLYSDDDGIIVSSEKLAENESQSFHDFS
jgi:regulator of ribonuclease activity A